MTSIPSFVRRTPWVLLPVLALGGSVWSQSDPLPPPSEEVFQQDVGWSPDGRSLVFSEYSGGPDYKPEAWSIETLQLDDGARRRVASNALCADWSPDGARIAFGAEREGNWDVYTSSVDGSDVKRVTTFEGKDGQPSWSPDGTQIAFSSERDGNRDIYTIAADGTGLKRLTTDPAADYNPDWSPDGESIVFYREKGDGMDQVVRVAADGSTEWPVTADQRHNVFPRFLPDGRIVFSSGEKGSGESQLTVCAADGSNRSAIPAPGFIGAFSPDGRWVAFIAGDGWPKSAIYVSRPDGTELRKVVN